MTLRSVVSRRVTHSQRARVAKRIHTKYIHTNTRVDTVTFGGNRAIGICLLCILYMGWMDGPRWIYIYSKSDAPRRLYIADDYALTSRRSLAIGISHPSIIATTRGRRCRDDLCVLALSGIFHVSKIAMLSCVGAYKLDWMGARKIMGDDVRTTIAIWCDGWYLRICLPHFICAARRAYANWTIYIMCAVAHA